MAALFDPLVVAIGKHVCAGEVLHADDTTVKVLAPGLGRTKTGRLWAAVRLTRYTTDGRLEMTNNAVERAIRPLAMTRKNYLFAGSDSGGIRAAAMYTLIETTKMNGLDPEAYLRDIIARIADHPINRIAELLPWNWRPTG